MDYDEAMNISASFDEDDYLPSSVSRDQLAQEIMFIIFFIVGICADVAIIYTIFNFKKMRTVPNIFIANWAIADMCSLIVTPSGYRIISVISKFSIPHWFMCFLEQSGSSFHVNVFLFVILILVDWFIGAHFGRASERLRSNYKFIIAGIWILTIMMATTFTGICLSDRYMFIHQFFQLVICYLAALLLIVILQCSRIVNKFRNSPLDYPTLPLTLATVFITVSFLSFMALFLTPAMHKAFEVFAVCLVFSSAVLNFAVLYLFDKDFHACLLQALRRTGDRYEESISDFNNPIRDIEDKDRVKISFEGSEELLSNDAE